MMRTAAPRDLEFYFKLVELANTLRLQLPINQTEAEALDACTKRAKELMVALEKVSHPITEWKY
jgi:hypothetical protein